MCQGALASADIELYKKSCVGHEVTLPVAARYVFFAEYALMKYSYFVESL
ncbi:hypothetical protein ACD661_01005 [Legionella lytica]|uniref:Uncharacterized protein n=1 Tax=Legionella lytica TaxID=96232 RepID=A0ABW8D6J6_9GAMM